MSQTEERKSKSPHKLQIKPRAGCEDQISTVANTHVYLDGKLLAGCSFVKFEAKAKGVTKVMLEIFATVEMECNVILEEKEKPTDLTISGKPVTLRQLGTYAPMAIAVKQMSPDGIVQDVKKDE